MNQEDCRIKNFQEKFQAAAVALNATSYLDIEALKFRGPASSQDYYDLLKELVGLKSIVVKGNYQGKAWKLTNADNNSIIIVEHETGLEILYIAGALASIISIVPIVINAWSMIRGHWPPFKGRSSSGGLERRRFDKNDKLVEEPALSVDAIILHYVFNQYDKLNERISSLESEVSKLKRSTVSPSKSVIRKKMTKISDNNTK